MTQPVPIAMNPNPENAKAERWLSRCCQAEPVTEPSSTARWIELLPLRQPKEMAYAECSKCGRIAEFELKED